MFVRPRTNAKLKNSSLGKTTSSEPIAKPHVAGCCQKMSSPINPEKLIVKIYAK